MEKPRAERLQFIFGGKPGEDIRNRAQARGLAVGAIAGRMAAAAHGKRKVRAERVIAVIDTVREFEEPVRNENSAGGRTGPGRSGRNEREAYFLNGRHNCGRRPGELALS